MMCIVQPPAVSCLPNIMSVSKVRPGAGSPCRPVSPAGPLSLSPWAGPAPRPPPGVLTEYCPSEQGDGGDSQTHFSRCCGHLGSSGVVGLTRGPGPGLGVRSEVMAGDWPGRAGPAG